MTEAQLTVELIAASAAAGGRTRCAERAAVAIRRGGGYRLVGVNDVTPDEIVIVGGDRPARIDVHPPA